MAKNCPYCQTELPDDAAFCYECGKPQPSPSDDEPRRPPRWLPVLLFILVVITGFSVFQMSQPKDFLGTYELDYTAEDDMTYHLALSFGPLEEASDGIVHTDGSPLTSYLYITDEDGTLSNDIFCKFVDDVEVIALPVAGTPVADMSPLSNYGYGFCSTVTHNSDVGANIIRWTLEMENGDKLIVSHRIDYTEPQK